MRSVIYLVCASFILSGCGEAKDMPKEEIFRIEGQVYRIPTSDIDSSGVTNGRYSDGSDFEIPHVAIRIDDPKAYLAFDYRNNNKRELAPGVPFIWQVSSKPSSNLRTFEVDGKIIICESRPGRSDNCGFRITFEGATWVVYTFGGDLLDWKTLIKRAENKLKAYVGQSL